MRSLVVVLAVLMAGCATPRQNEMLWHGLNAVDGFETISRCEGVIEANPIIGKDPSDAKVAAYMVGFSVLYHYLNKWVERNDPEHLKAFQWMTLGIKSIVVVNNAVVINDAC